MFLKDGVAVLSRQEVGDVDGHFFDLCDLDAIGENVFFDYFCGL